MKEDLVVCGLHARPGEKIHAYVDACGTDEKIPVTLIHGRYAGKRLVITAGVHGAEYPGIIADWLYEIKGAVDSIFAGDYEAAQTAIDMFSKN